MQEQQKKKKSVLGLRFSYLSKIQDVRETIRTQMRRRALLDIMRPFTVEHVPEDVVIDVRDDEREDFAGKLDELDPGRGLGEAYLGEDEVKNRDKREKREHDWDHWDRAVSGNEDLRGQLHRAVQTVLEYEKEVDAYGTYEAPSTAVVDHDSGRPQLDFWTTERYVADYIDKA
jgi:hypothetical protein